MFDIYIKVWHSQCKQHPLVHHPLDACYSDSVVDETLTEVISGFTLVTDYVRSGSYEWVDG